MSGILSLWLPILATAVGVFVASSIIHMVIKWHSAEYQALPNEEAVMDALRAGAPTPGQYVVPHCADMKAMQDAAMQAKYRAGPVAFMTIVKSAPPAMGKPLLLWFVFNIVVAAFAASIVLQARGPGGDAHMAGHLVALITFLAYAGGSVQLGIWMGKPWVAVLKDGVDALIYSVVSAYTFIWLWP